MLCYPFFEGTEMFKYTVLLLYPKELGSGQEVEFTSKQRRERVRCRY